MASETPRAGTTKEIGCREDTAGGGERKNSTRCRSLTKANPGTAKRKAAIDGEGRKGPTGDSQLPGHNRTNARRNPRTSQNDRGNWFQPIKVEERNGPQETSERGPRTPEPHPPKGTQKSWAEVVGFKQVASWDRC